VATASSGTCVWRGCDARAHNRREGLSAVELYRWECLPVLSLVWQAARGVCAACSCVSDRVVTVL